MAKIPSEKELSDLLGGGGSEAGGGLDFGYYLHLLIRYLWLFLAIVILAAGIAAYFALRQPRMFVSSGVLQVEAEEQKVLASDDVRPSSLEATDYIPTIVANLTSDSLLVRVAKAAGLLDDPTFFKPKENGEPYTEIEIAGRMRGIVTVISRKLTRLIDISANGYGARTCSAHRHDIDQGIPARRILSNKRKLARAASDFLRDESDKLKAKLQQSDERLQKL